MMRHVETALMASLWTLLGLLGAYALLATG